MVHTLCPATGMTVAHGHCSRSAQAHAPVPGLWPYTVINTKLPANIHFVKSNFNPQHYVNTYFGTQHKHVMETAFP